VRTGLGRGILAPESPLGPLEPFLDRRRIDIA
jgi:hypothetical protein